MVTNESQDRYRQAATVFAAILGAAGVAALTYFLLAQIWRALLPFLYALIIVYFARPVVDFMENLRVPRFLTVLTAYLIVLLIIGLFAVIILPLVVNEANDLIKAAPTYLEASQEYLADLQIRLPHELDGVVKELQNQAGSFALNLAQNLPQTVLGFFGGVFNVFLAWLLSFYILRDLPKIRATLTGLIPETHRANVVHIFKEIDVAVGGYLRGQLIVALAIGIMVTIYLLILGVDFAVLIGLTAGVLNIIPYFGAIVGGGLAMTVALFDSVRLALLVVVGMVVIQQIEGAIISPTVMRHTVNLHPTIVVLSLLIGGSLFGIFGLLFAIPVAAASKALLLHYAFGPHVEVVDEG